MGVSTGTFSIGTGGVRTGAITTQTVTQQLIASFQGTGLLDTLLVFNPNDYTTPGNSPGVLVDALGGPITYTAPNTQATPSVVAHSSGYYYASADGVDDTLVANTNQTVAYYCAVFRSPPGQTTWNDYAAIIDRTDNTIPYLGLANPGTTSFFNATGYLPRSVTRNGTSLTSPFACSPLNVWQALLVGTGASTSSVPLQIFGVNSSRAQLHLAALGIRYTDPTSDQQTQIESRMAPVRDALLASAS